MKQKKRVEQFNEYEGGYVPIGELWTAKVLLNARLEED